MNSSRPSCRGSASPRKAVVALETLDPDADYYYREATRSIAPGQRSRVPDAPAFRIRGIAPRLDAAPLYAGDTGAVLEDWLGLDADAVADLVAAGALVF